MNQKAAKSILQFYVMPHAFDNEIEQKSDKNNEYFFILHRIDEGKKSSMGKPLNIPATPSQRRF